MLDLALAFFACAPRELHKEGGYVFLELCYSRLFVAIVLSIPQSGAKFACYHNMLAFFAVGGFQT